MKIEDVIRDRGSESDRGEEVIRPVKRRRIIPIASDSDDIDSD